VGHECYLSDFAAEKLLMPNTRSVIELFDDKRRYLIPLYQRQYAWQVEPQLRLLWEDIRPPLKIPFPAAA